MDVGLQNEKMTALLIEHLIAQGVERFCIAPGSRSTALALAVAQNPRAQADIHFDERGLGFYALGRAKGSRKPVVLIVTSGTAVGNLLPAVMEASNDHVPLILLTAYRPQELRYCSANQTCDQVKLFSSFVRWQADLPLSDPRFSPHFLASSIGQAVYQSQFPKPGPVHLNCMIRKPFYSSGTFEMQLEAPRFCERGTLIPSSQTIDEWVERLSPIKKGLMLVGSLPHNAPTDVLFALAEKLGWPIYADILSQMRTRSHPHLITYFDALIQSHYQQPIEAVLHWGERTVSKNVSEWLKKQTLSFYLHISDYPTLVDPHYIVTHRMHASYSLCAQMLIGALCKNSDPDWLDFWKQGNEKIKGEMEQFFLETREITEPGIIYHIGNHCKDNIGVFLSNSMPIRDADKFFSSCPYQISFFCNRGVSGIDGNIATAIGIAQGIQKPLIAVLGDLAFLHDMNSLALLNHAAYPVCLIIVNNAGGGLFSFLPVYEKKESFEAFFAAAHPYSFSQAASLFQIPYAQPQIPDDIDVLLKKFLKENRSIFIEVFTDRTENLQVHQQIARRFQCALQEIQSALSRSS